MTLAYFIVLVACSLAVAVLVVWRLANLRRHAAPSRGRLLNEWIWTLIPVATLIFLLYQARP